MVELVERVVQVARQTLNVDAFLRAIGIEMKIYMEESLSEVDASWNVKHSRRQFWSWE